VSCEQEFGIELDPKALVAADALRSVGGLAQVVQSALDV
jgi:acyl carrier protein